MGDLVATSNLPMEPRERNRFSSAQLENSSGMFFRKECSLEGLLLTLPAAHVLSRLHWVNADKSILGARSDGFHILRHSDNFLPTHCTSMERIYLRCLQRERGQALYMPARQCRKIRHSDLTRPSQPFCVAVVDPMRCRYRQRLAERWPVLRFMVHNRDP